MPGMTGMNNGLTVTNPVLVAAFRAALMHQGLIALLVLATLAIIWASFREWLPGRVTARPPAVPEPAGRTLLRTGFGLLWIFDGILQAQPAMAAGLPGKVIAPAAAQSPDWVRHLVAWATNGWSFHPVQASAAAVWIQVGIGIWLVSVRHGTWSRLAGLASVGWGLIVWVFGEAFGGMFAPGQSLLFGAPGAVAFYCVAGGLVALPDRAWQSPRLGRRLTAGVGTLFIGMAVLQAWPGRGFWQGGLHGKPGSLTAMVSAMAGTPQPSVLAGWVSGFASLTARHGFAVNLVAVIALALIGSGLLVGALGGAALAGRRDAGLPGGGRYLPGKPVLAGTVAFAALALLADWVLIEDLGFLGGLGTDPNSMVPLLLLVFAGYLAIIRPARAAGVMAREAEAARAEPWSEAADSPSAQPGGRSGWRSRLRPAALAGAFASAGAQGVLACWAVIVLALGAAPMAAAQASASADPIIARAIDGASAPLDLAAPGFSLTDQHGRPVTLASLRGKVVLMTFLDPVCTTDCPILAQEFRAADELLGSRASQVMLVAVVANPLYHTAPYVQAFDRQEEMNGLPNWLYLTGRLAQLRRVWASYGVSAVVAPGGQMVAHDDVAFVIDRRGRIRTELNLDPGPGSASSRSSFATELAQAAELQLSGGQAPS